MYKVNNETGVTTAQDMQIRDVVALMSFNETSFEGKQLPANRSIRYMEL